MFKLLAFIVLILAFIFTFYSSNERENLDEWINSNKIVLTNDNTTLNEFKIEFNQAEWNFLSNKLENTRYYKILDEKKVKRNQFGFDPEFAQLLVDYWRQEFNWSKQIDFLNKYPQFKLITKHLFWLNQVDICHKIKKTTKQKFGYVHLSR